MQFEWDKSKRISNIRKVKTVSALFPRERQLNLSKQPISSKSETDWERLDTMTDEDIDFSDCPEIKPKQFAKAIVRQGLPVDKNKAQVTLRIDSDVLEWFKSQGKGYQTKINSFGLSLKEKAIKLRLIVCYERIWKLIIKLRERRFTIKI